jgi:hypothetical protein
MSGDDQPTELIAGIGGDRCPNCGSTLASDQRYCVECGQRRGKPRFNAPAGQQAAAAAPPPRRRLPQATAGTTLILGIGVLLLAMGVGFEIGNGSGTKTVASSAPSAPQVITINGGGTAAPTTATTPASTAKLPKTKAKITKKVAAKASAAASKVLGSSSKNLAPPTAKVGAKCTHGAGCDGGKFTGSFFGP